MMARKRKLSAADKALIERAEAVGSTAYRDNAGDVVAMIIHNPERLSLADRKRLREMIADEDARLVAQGGKVVHMPNPANLMGGEKFLAPPWSAAYLGDAIRIAAFTHAESRVERLKRHAELADIVGQLTRALPVEEGRLDKDFHAVIPSDPFWAELANAEKLALAYDAAPRVIRDHKRQAAAKRGGKRAGKSAEAKAASSHIGWVALARKAIEAGKEPRNVSGMIARRVGVSAKQVRTVLQRAGIVTRREVKGKTGKREIS